MTASNGNLTAQMIRDAVRALDRANVPRKNRQFIVWVNEQQWADFEGYGINSFDDWYKL